MLQCTGTECERTGTAALYEANYRVPFKGRQVKLVCERHAVELEVSELVGTQLAVPSVEDLSFIEL